MKYNNNYFKFFNINKGYERNKDESLYTEFLDCYEYGNELFDNPYITYHPSFGGLYFKTKSKKKLLSNKIDSYKSNDIKKDKIYEIFFIEISPTIFNKLEKISINDIKKLRDRKWICLVEVDPSPKEIIQLDEDKETFIIFDMTIKKNLNLCFYINKIINKDVLEKISDGNYISTYFLNTDLGLTIFLKEGNIDTNKGIQDLRVIIGEESFNLELAKDSDKDNKNN